MHKESPPVLSSNYREGHMGPEVLEKKKDRGQEIPDENSLFVETNLKIKDLKEGTNQQIIKRKALILSFWAQKAETCNKSWNYFSHLWQCGRGVQTERTRKQRFCSDSQWWCRRAVCRHPAGLARHAFI